MRSLSSLLSNPPSSRYKPLPSIAANDSPHFTNKTDARCAFHLNEKIINFCRDPHCLLPLCPRCIKIHSEEHNQMGTLPRFEPIDECLAEAHDYFLQIFGSIADLQKTSFDADDAYKNKVLGLLFRKSLSSGNSSWLRAMLTRSSTEYSRCTRMPSCKSWPNKTRYSRPS